MNLEKKFNELVNATLTASVSVELIVLTDNIVKVLLYCENSNIEILNQQQYEPEVHIDNIDYNDIDAVRKFMFLPDEQTGYTVGFKFARKDAMMIKLALGDIILRQEEYVSIERKDDLE